MTPLNAKIESSTAPKPRKKRAGTAFLRVRTDEPEIPGYIRDSLQIPEPNNHGENRGRLRRMSDNVDDLLTTTPAYKS
jgi:hypothetical protein